MKIKCSTPVGLSRTVLAAAIAVVLSGPVYAADPEPTAGHPAATRATATADADRTNVAAVDRANVAAADRGTVSDEAKSADNTARNSRDADGDEMTPLDQSHAESDVEMTRAIRQSLVDDDTLGTNAQNVKVITVDGKVTLRGPVASAEEKARIVAIANKAAGPDRVMNELEVIKR